MAKPILIQLREANAELLEHQALMIRKAARGYALGDDDMAELDRLVAEFKRIANEAAAK